METYLFDTNIWKYWFSNEKDVAQQIEQFDEKSTIGLSVIVLGEILYGANLNPEFDTSSYMNFIYDKRPIIFDIDKHVSKVYSELRARLFDKFGPRELRRKVKRPEQLIDPATSLHLGIQENDLWLMAQALTYNLVLVTNDSMNNLSKVAPKELKCKNWQQEAQR